MTEAEWLVCADWREMFEVVEGKVTDRKWRLFAVACCRDVWRLLTEDGRLAVEVAERFADKFATSDELHSIRELFRASDTDQVVHIIQGHRYRPDLGGATVIQDAYWAAKHAMRESADLVTRKTLRSTGRDFTDKEFVSLLNAEMTRRRRLLHEMLGPVPFQTIHTESSWQAVNVLAVAQTIYSERRFADMPVLADALEEAGCDNEVILSHCRRPGPHVRGCWVIDLVLGK